RRPKARGSCSGATHSRATVCRRSRAVPSEQGCVHEGRRVSTFATPLVHGAALTRVTPSSPVPDLRFKGDLLMWVGVPVGATISAFATGAIARAQGTSDGIPGDSSAAWTLFQHSPLPQMNAAAFKLVPGGLPVQLVLVAGGASATPAADD